MNNDRESRSSDNTAGNQPLWGRVAFVTGGGTGIGRATALAFAEKGASVVVAGLDSKQLEDVARLISESGGRALAVTCDLVMDGGQTA